MESEDLIKSYCIDTNKPGPKVLVTAGVHGDEYEPILTALKLIDQLPKILKSGSVTIVPITNESAYLHSSRYGEDGLDMARVCPGNAEGTVTERAAAQISALIKKSEYFIDMHTGGLAFDIYPLVGYMLHPVSEVLKKQQEMAAACHLPLVWGTDPGPDGRTLSVARDANIPAIYLEYGGGTAIRSHVISRYCNAVINILRYLKMTTNPAGDIHSENKFWIEDNRPDSGYLQGKMPSPAEGIFVAEVEVGYQIKKGQLFGKVIESSGQSTEVYADISGLVFLLRTMVKVKCGDALGGIMPIESINKKVVYE
jgi:predicted deacylase